MTSSQNEPALADVRIRGLREPELPEATHVFRLAFGTFLGMPDPSQFWADTAHLTTRWRADSASVFAAEAAGTIVGSNVANHWGSVGFVGPLTVHPSWWDRGIGQRLMEPVMQHLRAQGVRHAGLFTFAQSAKHHALYQKFGFYPRFLTAIVSRPVDQVVKATEWACFSAVPEQQRPAVLADCQALTDSIYAGLDLTGELRSIQAQALGDTVLLWSGSQLVAFACCHCGPGTEAGTDICYVKCAAVRPGVGTGAHFEQLLCACEAFAGARHLRRLEVGVNLGRRQAYQQLLAAGYRVGTIGVAMETAETPGYNHEQVYLLDDWR
jgi:N-acetylglutamate synthase-like GNAT family acetyltransferase